MSVLLAGEARGYRSVKEVGCRNSISRPWKRLPRATCGGDRDAGCAGDCGASSIELAASFQESDRRVGGRQGGGAAQGQGPGFDPQHHRDALRHLRVGIVTPPYEAVEDRDHVLAHF
jgi:hypothetical protein